VRIIDSSSLKTPTFKEVNPVKMQIQLTKIDWWFWAITLIFIFSALFGWDSGYIVVMAISALQVLYFWMRLKSLIAFDTQVRIVYLAFTLLGLVAAVRFPFFVLLFVGTLMVVLFNRCGIALGLKHMPWNQERLVQIDDSIK